MLHTGFLWVLFFVVVHRLLIVVLSLLEHGL